MPFLFCLLLLLFCFPASAASGQPLFLRGTLLDAQFSGQTRLQGELLESGDTFTVDF